MDNGAGLISAEWQQNKEDLKKELAQLRDWMRAHEDDGLGLGKRGRARNER
jgi:hypothetical protein